MWTEQRFGANAQASLAGPLEDPDGNGVANLMEYALGGAAGQPFALGMLPQAQRSEDRLNLSFQRIADASLTYTVEAGDSLATMVPIWTSTGAANIAGPVSVQDIPEAVGRPQRFMRLRVSEPTD
jgi:hypothetical protein